ncbi:MAG: septal ring lytic transglycosylase RlpA family protein [Candidatus Paracaedimonas acanthamoebae]|uniref:Endolytic peptidoglycan transglycosylase RlpA n=1 Tax=Candidatus Paracaedimonas acanthamoebae TaxID=244581 RepID=A0A8J7PLP9_9PROT|nr:septal ring lytic transglycosylase RlpA family protein [Candidatus Paracaedimonas acanthamoebae]
MLNAIDRAEVVHLITQIKSKHSIKSFAQVLSLLATLFLGACGGPCDDFESLSACSQVHPNFAKKAYNKPYQIKGEWYTPQSHYNIDEEGIASYYGGTDVFHGRKTSNGEIFDMNEVSAAHKTAPIPCVLEVKNLENGRSIKVKVNDRGPFIEGRIIDVSRRTAQLLGFYKQGTARVRVKILMPETMILVQGHTNTIEPGLKETLLAQNVPQKKQKEKQNSFNKTRAPQNHEPILLALKDEITKFSQEIKHEEKKSEKTEPIIQKVNYTSSRNGAGQATYKKGNNARYRTNASKASFTKGVFIQAGTFAHPQQAQQAKVLIQRRLSSMPVRLESIKFSKKQLYRVVVGPCGNDVQARKLANHIKSMGCSTPSDSIVVFNG